MARTHPCELSADFQQYYHLDLSSVSARKAADLAVMLPGESRVMRALDPAAGWGVSECLLSLAEYWLHVLVWRETKDAKARRNVPERITPRSVSNRQATGFSAPAEEYAALLARSRKEVPYGK